MVVMMTTLKMAQQRRRFSRFPADSPAGFWFLAAIVAFAALALAVHGSTDPSDVQGLQVLYTSLNSPSQLTNWKSSGGDPCAESWKGVTCEGSAVISIEISGLGLSGTLGYLLTNLMSLRNFDLSNNNIHDAIPYQLPPNLTSLNLAGNNLSGNLPYSISTMVSLTYLNTSRNSLSTSIGDVFANLTKLGTIDLSFNNLSGDLPSSFTSLTNLSSLYLQSNQLTGSLDVFTSLPLTTLNVANNHFSGWIPQELISIPTFIYGGNTFANGPAPPPPPYTPPPPGKSRENRTRSGSSPPSTTKGSDSSTSGSSEGLATGAIVGIVVGALLLVLVLVLAFCFCSRKNRMEGGRASSVGSQTTAKPN
ncbi:hypothetical protein CRG98_022223, partial [Punica granatum]